MAECETQREEESRIHTNRQKVPKKLEKQEWEGNVVSSKTKAINKGDHNVMKTDKTTAKLIN